MAYYPTMATNTYSNVTIANGGNMVYTTGTGGVPLWTNATTATAYYPKQPKVQITDSDIEIDGLSLKATLKTLHERLAIMIPNPALEKEFEELKACGDEYRRLEQQFAEQLKMWNTLKSTDNK